MLMTPFDKPVRHAGPSDMATAVLHLYVLIR